MSKEKSGTRITLSPFGRYKQVETSKPPISHLEAGGGTGPFDWRNAFIDSGIIAGLTFFTTLGGVSLVVSNLLTTLVSALVSAATQFFLMLAIKRGLRKSE